MKRDSSKNEDSNVHSSLASALPRFAHLGFLFPLLLSVVVLLAWLVQVPAILRIRQDWPTMKVNTAVCFIALGIMGRFISQGKNNSGRWVVGALGGIVAFLSIASLCEWAWPINLGVDNWLIENFLDGPALSRMPPAAALCFIGTVLGTFGIVFLPQRATSISQWLLFLSLLNSFLVLVSYLVAGRSLEHSALFSSMSLHSSVLFVWTNICLLMLTTHSGIPRTFIFDLFGSQALRQLFPITTVSLILVTFTIYHAISMGLLERNLGASVLITGTILINLFAMVRIASWMNRVDLSKRIADKSQQKMKEERNLALLREESAQKTSKFKSDFLANMSHEIRTPLNGVVGMADALSSTSLNPQQSSFLQSIRTSSEALLGIVNDVLDLSKIEAGRVELERSQFSLDHLVRDIIKELGWSSSARNIKIEFVDDSKLTGLVEGDPKRIRQVLANLMVNAIKFTNRGQISISLRTLESSGKNATLEFAVSDTGMGIPEEMIPRLFTPFFQANGSPLEARGGTGLGLVISKQLVELMGGNIGVASKINHGTRFWFTIPVALMPENSISKIESNSAWFCPIRSVRPKILIAEDMEINQKVMVHYMEKLHCDAVIVANGREAVQAVRDNEFDLVFLDCQMPVLDGFGATKEIRALPGPKSSIPIIALTAQAVMGDRQRCLDAGMDDYIPKPVQLARLKQVLETWIGRALESEAALASDAKFGAGSPRVNRAQLDQLIALDEGTDLVHTMVDHFRKQAPARLQAIESSLKNLDIPGIHRDAHTLKSSSAYLGALRISSLCDEIESLADRGDFSSIELLQPILQSECALLASEIESELKR